MLNDFIAFLSKLTDNRSLRIIENTVSDVINKNDFRQFDRKYKRANKILKVGIPIEDFKKFLSLGSLTLDWSIALPQNLGNLWGGFQIHGYASALGSPSHFWDTYNSGNRVWKHNPYPEDEAIYKEFLPKLNYFQKSGHGDDGTYGCFLREEGVYPCAIYFYDSGIWFPMDLTLEEYYEAMIASNAVYYWQYFYIDTALIVKKLGNYKPIYEEYGSKYATGPCPFLDKYKNGELVTSAQGVLYQMKIIIDSFPEIFPGYDLTFFKEKYQALEKALDNL